MNIDREYLVGAFLKYVSYDSQSNPENEKVPSSEGQLALAKVLYEDLKNLGLQNVQLSKNGFVTALLPANTEGVPAIGFLAHMDTSPDSSGKNIKPNTVKNYDGSDIILASGKVLSPSEFSDLKACIGCDLITTDGTTLLGADDKAGIAEIYAAVAYLIKNPDISHGDVMVAFTPDEEIGTGMDAFNAKDFPVQFAYTVDGGKEGDLNYETFNAAKAKITITGKSVHTGSAKGIMINAGQVAAEFAEGFPKDEMPVTTDGYQGFYHLNDMKCGVENAVINYILRDHDMEKFKARKAFIKEAVNKINEKYGQIAAIEVTDQYYNMAEKVNETPECLNLALKAMETLGIKPNVAPIRGGTDGSRLSFMGIPCPNIYAGGQNAHGPFEFACIDHMVSAAKLIVTICSLAAKK